jgi:ABC-type glycerol-3-phosphate transport system substrate-binding protein
MTVRGTVLLLALGLPALGLLLFGPRRQQHIPPGRTVIRYWEKWSGVERDAMLRIVDRFNRTEGAERKIWVDYCAVSNVDQRMLIATAGGDPPDVAGLFDYAVPQFADQGALMVLDEAAERAGIDVDAFKPIWLDIGRYEGKLYALPSTPYTVALYYNRGLYRDAGLDPDRPPRTLSELNAYALRLTRVEKKEAEGKKFASLGFTTSPGMLGWWHWIWPCFFDARLWDGQRFRIDTPEARAAMAWIADRRARLGNQEVLAFEATSGSIEGPQNPFLSERIAMVFQGPWVSNWIRTYKPGLDYGVARFPSVTADRANVFASTDVFVIPSGSPHPEEAMVFLAYVFRQEVMEELCRAHGKVSPFRQPGAEFFENHPNPFIRVFDEMAQSEHAFGYPKMPMFAEASMELLTMLESVLRGVRAPEEAVRMAQAKIDTIVADYQEMAERRRVADR